MEGSDSLHQGRDSNSRELINKLGEVVVIRDRLTRSLLLSYMQLIHKELTPSRQMLYSRME